MASVKIVTALTGASGLQIHPGGGGILEAVNFTKAGSGDSQIFIYDTAATDMTAFPSAPAAPTVAAGSAGVLTGAYLYKITCLNNVGETIGGTESGSVSPSAQSVNLTNIPTGTAGTTARKIYRTQAAGGTGTEKFVAVIGDNTTTTYNDNASDASIVGNAAVPGANVIRAAILYDGGGTTNSSFIQGITGVTATQGMNIVISGTTSPRLQMIMQ